MHCRRMSMKKLSTVPAQAKVTICRGCGGATSDWLGTLPDSNLFAGVRLRSPLFGGDLYRCPHCNLVFRYPVLSAKEYGELYAHIPSNVWSGGTSRSSRTDQRLVKRYIEEQF